MRLCLEGGLATTEVPLSWSPCVEDGGDQLQPPAMLSHTDRVYRYKVTPQVPCLQFTSSHRLHRCWWHLFSLRWRGHGRVSSSTRGCVSRRCKLRSCRGRNVVRVTQCTSQQSLQSGSDEEGGGRFLEKWYLINVQNVSHLEVRVRQKNKRYSD